MKLLFWNVRGFLNPGKQGGVFDLIKKHDVSIFGLLETKMRTNTLREIMSNKFSSWVFVHNFDHHVGGRIVVAWDPSRVVFTPKLTTPQILHGTIHCLTRKTTFELSFVYALNNLVMRRDLWTSLSLIGNGLLEPWALLGDFNNILHPHERVNGKTVTMYELKDFSEACATNALEDLPFHGPLLTWNNNTVWSKLDRAMINAAWLEAGLLGFAEFFLPGCLSDHAYGIVTLIDAYQRPKPPFRFFNMWTKHPTYHEVIKTKWEEEVRGTKQFQLFMKLRDLKPELKKLNAKHYSHISERYKGANEKLIETQARIHDNPSNTVLKAQVATLRKEASRLKDAERAFFSAKSKDEL